MTRFAFGNCKSGGPGRWPFGIAVGGAALYAAATVASAVVLGRGGVYASLYESWLGNTRI